MSATMTEAWPDLAELADASKTLAEAIERCEILASHMRSLSELGETGPAAYRITHAEYGQLVQFAARIQLESDSLRQDCLDVLDKAVHDATFEAGGTS